jgi:predicted O-linked N-acetylglucosamine transferase (SPINDLY family)
VLLDLAQFDAAREHLETLVASGAADGETFANLGIAFQQAGDYEAAAVWFARAVDATPGLTPALADLVHARQYLCAWDGLDALEARLAATLDDPHADPRLSPFITLSLHFSPAQQLAAARRWSGATLPAVGAPAVITARGDRLRIGYLSSDFRDHATGRLMVGLIEAHDRRRIDVFGYGYGRGAYSPLRRRIVAAFDQWRDLGGAGDADIAAAIRADRIDVLIDRKGHTRGGRLAALAERPATVQLHYMSFPATLGYHAIDGLIADAIVVPPGDDAHYHERVFRLPRCYFVTDSARTLPDRAARGDHGLADDAIVLACLNQAYKLTPAMFAIWMDALRAAPRAMLWLLATHPRAQANLRAEAIRSGVEAHRLAFAPEVDQDAHIARLRSADLALDTLPYGSHTTGVDALWGGVPLLTCRGATFAGRVGASLLAAVDLNELVTEDADAYRERLVELVTHPDRLRDYAAHLERGRKTFPLFDTRGFAGDFERLLADAYDEITAVGRAGPARTIERISD